MSRDQWLGLVAAVASISIFAFALSLTSPLLAFLLERMGTSGVVIGLSGAAPAIAIALAGPFLPALLRWLSLPKLLIVSLVLVAVVLPLFPLFPVVWLWIILRFAFGFFAVSLFYGSELWIIAAAPPGRRGIVLGVYGVFLSLGFLAGPLVLQVIGFEGMAPFLIAAVAALCGVPLIWWARHAAPRDMGGPPQPLRDIFRYWRSDGAAIWAILLFGAVETGAMGLFGVWGVRVGMTEAAALTLVALLAVGNVVMQVPIGLLGDRYDRRKLMMICAGGCVLAAGALPALAGTSWPLWLVTGLWGGWAVGLYLFGMMMLGDRYQGEELARANAAAMTAYGVGALLAPPLMGQAMDLAPPHGMFWVLGAGALAYLALIGARRA